jgi:hypothetical protein
MIVNNFYVMAMAIPPDEANPPLIVDPNRVLSLSIALQSLELVSWGRCQHSQFRRGMQLQQFS